MKTTAFVPIKRNSERIPGKNKRLFNGRPLFTVILETLQSCENIEYIIVNSDCPDIRQAVANNYSKAIVVERPPHLFGGHISGNDLIDSDLDKVISNHFFQTHCTSPLLTKGTINRALQLYFNSLDDYDSLFSVNKIQARLYRGNGSALDHDPEKLLRTQDMKAVYKESSDFFVFSRQSFLNAGKNRIGLKPQLFEMNPIESVDIDYEEDFQLAELIDRNRASFSNIFNS